MGRGLQAILTVQRGSGTWLLGPTVWRGSCFYATNPINQSMISTFTKIKEVNPGQPLMDRLDLLWVSKGSDLSLGQRAEQGCTRGRRGLGESPT